MNLHWRYVLPPITAHAPQSSVVICRRRMNQRYTVSWWSLIARVKIDSSKAVNTCGRSFWCEWLMWSPIYRLKPLVYPTVFDSCLANLRSSNTEPSVYHTYKRGHQESLGSVHVCLYRHAKSARHQKVSVTFVRRGMNNDYGSYVMNNVARVSYSIRSPFSYT